MRSAVLCVLTLLMSAGSVLADPSGPTDAKPWSYDFGPPRSTYPEAEPNDDCPGMAVNCSDVVEPSMIATGEDNDYFTVEDIPAGAILVFGTSESPTADPDLGDSFIELYYGCTDTRVAYDDDSGPGLYSLLTYVVPASGAGSYSLRVRGYDASSIGYYRLAVSCTLPMPPPENDDCGGAITLSRCTSGSVTGDLTFASNDYDPGVPGPSCTGYSAAGKDVVYRVYLEAGDTVQLTYVGSPSAFDGSIYIVTDCADICGSCVAGADSYPNPPGEGLLYAVEQSGTYYIICDAYGTNVGGPFVLDYVLDCPVQTGACCVPGGGCALLSEEDCSAAGGSFLGGGCHPDPCPPPAGACCLPDGACVQVTEPYCSDLEGEWLGPVFTCIPNPCPQPEPFGACCLPDGTCQVLTQPECSAAQGGWHGEMPDCDPDPCSPVPIEEMSWGRVKAVYR